MALKHDLWVNRTWFAHRRPPPTTDLPCARPKAIKHPRGGPNPSKRNARSQTIARFIQRLPTSCLRVSASTLLGVRRWGISPGGREVQTRSSRSRPAPARDGFVNQNSWMAADSQSRPFSGGHWIGCLCVLLEWAPWPLFWGGKQHHLRRSKHTHHTHRRGPTDSVLGLDRPDLLPADRSAHRSFRGK